MKVALFVTCLVDLFRPSVGFASAKLLEQAGCQVEVPAEQTCCGQPAFNSGDARTARDLARRVIEQCEGYDYVVLPSGSCAAMIRVHYPELFADDAKWRERAGQLATRTYELVSFLVEVRGVKTVPAEFTGKLAYHDSCSGLRELGIRQQPRQLLASVKGLTRVELGDPEACCGFGGTFCVKYPEISAKLADDKLADAASTGADTLLGGDLGCLLHLAGRMRRKGSAVRVYHTAEILAGMADVPGLGDGPKETS